MTQSENGLQTITFRVKCLNQATMETTAIQNASSTNREKLLSILVVTQSYADQLIIKLALRAMGLERRLIFLNSFEDALTETILMFHGTLNLQIVGLVCFDVDLFSNDMSALIGAIRNYRNSLVQAQIKELPTCVIIHTPTNDSTETTAAMIASYPDLSDCKLLAKPV